MRKLHLIQWNDQQKNSDEDSEHKFVDRPSQVLPSPSKSYLRFQVNRFQELVGLLESALTVLQEEEGTALGLKVKWRKTKIQFLSDFMPQLEEIIVNDQLVECAGGICLWQQSPIACCQIHAH
jgi:hypothetical protein